MNSDRLSRFVRHVIEKSLTSDTGRLKEYPIGVDVYGRPPGYDPRTDSIVRVEASRLRSRLREYYSEAGAADPIRIEIPKGGYAVTFVSRIAEPRPEPPVALASRETAPVPSATAARRNLFLYVGGCIALIALAAIFLSGRGASAGNAIAVMQFVSFSSGPQNEDFANGLAAEISETLSVGF